MSSLNTNEKQILEKLFQMNGYVLNFTNRSFADFFRDDLGIDIYDQKYSYNGESKANRMRAFWHSTPDSLTGKSIQKLIEYIDNQILLGQLRREDFSSDLIARSREISRRLLGAVPKKEEEKEDEFINREFKDLSIDKLGLDGATSSVLKQRIEEIRKCLNAKAPLATIFLCGSTLEGILLGVATKDPMLFSQSVASPKDKDGKIKQLHDWTLNDLINVARSLNLVGEDVKKFSHALRDFRNYIHPYAQMSSGFDPDNHTAKICWNVLQAAIIQLSR